MNTIEKLKVILSLFLIGLFCATLQNAQGIIMTDVDAKIVVLLLPAGSHHLE